MTSSFLGRQAEIARLRELIVGARVVTLLGPAGIGKTRLATRFAELHAASSWFCDLTDARDVGAVCAAVARALGVSLASVKSSAQAVERVGVALATRGAALLILDNCEQATAAIAEVVTAWRDAAPSSVMLATSREVLRVSGERVYEVPPLDASEGARLFVERASLVRPGYALTDANESELATIIRSLDGLPLAIELAAARMGLLGVRDLVRLLPRRFELLSSGPRDASERQRTLRGAIEWSWNLLEPWEKSALAQATVFRGGFSLEAAEAVISTGTEKSLLDVLQSLRDKSLLRVHDDDGDARFGFYESIHELAFEKLREGEDYSAVMERHATYFAGATAPLAAGVNGAGGAEKLRRLAREEENLLVAHARSLEAVAKDPDAGERALRIVLALEALYTARGPMTRAISLLDATLASDATKSAGAGVVARVLLARALVGRQELSSILGANALGDFETTFAHAERALDAARAARDAAAEVDALCTIGALEVYRGRSEHGRAHAQAGAELAATMSDARLRGRCLFVLGVIDLFEGAQVDALDRLTKAQEQLSHADDHHLEGFALVALGVVLQERSRMDDAQRRFEQALDRFRELGRAHLQGYARGHLAGLHHERGELEIAQSDYEAAVELLEKAGEPSADYFRAGLGAVIAARGDQVQAAHLLDRAEAALSKSNVPSFLLAAARVYRASFDPSESARVNEATPFAKNSDEVRLALRIASSKDAKPAATAFVVARDGRDVRAPDGRTLDLRKRPRLRRLLVALVEARIRAPGKAQSVETLFAGVWQGERATYASSRQRVYTAIGELRDLGLRDLLLNDVDGYMLDPEIPVVFASS
jgi:predicted ATPase